MKTMKMVRRLGIAPAILLLAQAAPVMPALAGAPRTASAQGETAAIDAVMAGAIASQTLAGAVVGVIKDGRIVLVMSDGRWFRCGGRLISVPLETVAILGRHLNLLDIPRDDVASLPTWTSAAGRSLDRSATIRIAIGRR